MDEKFMVGVILGMLGGALLVTNSVKARQMVVDGQEQVEKKLNQLGKAQKNQKQE